MARKRLDPETEAARKALVECARSLGWAPSTAGRVARALLADGGMVPAEPSGGKRVVGNPSNQKTMQK